jgi:hypothetical protein
MLHRGDPLLAMMAASSGVAKYEQAFRSIVWRIDQLPKRDQGAYKTHLFECKLTIPSYDPMPEKFDPTVDVEYTMSQIMDNAGSSRWWRPEGAPTTEEDLLVSLQTK